MYTIFQMSDSHEHVPSDVSETHSTKKYLLLEIVQFALIALFVIVPFRMFVAQPFIVNGASMDPTFHSGEYLIVDQLTYSFTTPERGDVVIFQYPRNPSKFFIKRVIGLPGETVRIQEGTVIIINDEHPEGMTLDEPYIVLTATDSSSTTLSADEYFVMGDNRGGSSDSRAWGPLNEKHLIGRPILRLLPVTTIDVLPGIHTFDT